MARATEEDGKVGQRPIVRSTDRPGLIDKLFDLVSPAPETKPEAKAVKKDTAKPGEPAEQRKAPVMGGLARHEAALMRRLEVCDKLHEIALATNDKELDRLADVLDARARALYAQRTARAPKNSNSSDVDEQILDKKLGIEPLNPEQLPKGKPTAARTGRGDRYEAAAREEDR
jgi:hypothetical protein